MSPIFSSLYRTTIELQYNKDKFGAEFKALATHVESGRALGRINGRLVANDKSCEDWISEIARDTTRGIPSRQGIEFLWELRRLCKGAIKVHNDALDHEVQTITTLCKKILSSCTESPLGRKYLNDILMPRFDDVQVDWQKLEPFITEGFTKEALQKVVIVNGDQITALTGLWLAAYNCTSDDRWDLILQEFKDTITIKDLRTHLVGASSESSTTLLWLILAKTLTEGKYYSLEKDSHVIELWQWIAKSFSSELELGDFLTAPVDFSKVQTGLFHVLRAYHTGNQLCWDWVRELFWDKFSPEVFFSKQYNHDKAPRLFDFFYAACEKSPDTWALLCKMLAASKSSAPEYLGAHEVHGNKVQLAPKVKNILDLHEKILRLDKKMDSLLPETSDQEIASLQDDIARSCSSEGYYLLAKLLFASRYGVEQCLDCYRQVLPTSPLYCLSRLEFVHAVLAGSYHASGEPKQAKDRLSQLFESLYIIFELRKDKRYGTGLDSLKYQIVAAILGGNGWSALDWVDKKNSYFELEKEIHDRLKTKSLC